MVAKTLFILLLLYMCGQHKRDARNMLLLLSLLLLLLLCLMTLFCSLT